MMNIGVFVIAAPKIRKKRKSNYRVSKYCAIIVLVFWDRGYKMILFEAFHCILPKSFLGGNQGSRSFQMLPKPVSLLKLM